MGKVGGGIFPVNGRRGLSTCSNISKREGKRKNNSHGGKKEESNVRKKLKRTRKSPYHE